MKIRLITCLLPVLLIAGNLKSTPVEKLNAYFEGNEHECYYWHQLHHTNAPVISESDLIYLLSGKLGQNEGAAISSRDLSAALFLARNQKTDISPDLLLQALDTLTFVGGHNPELGLVSELSLTLASLGPKARNAMFSLRRSDDEVVSNAIVSALSVYGEEEMRERIYGEIQAIREQDMDRFKKRSVSFEFDPFSQLTASQNLHDYFQWKERVLDNADLLKFVGKNNLIKTSSTSRYPNEKTAESYLSINLRNIYWVSQLDEALSSASSSNERLQMEKRFREASIENFRISNISYRAKLYYLLGFELTEAEKEYLTDVLGLKADEFLPRGEIHLAGFNLDDFQSSDEQQLVATPEPEDLIPPIVEVASEEPIEELTLEPAEESSEKSSNWWLWLIGAVIIVGGIGFGVRRKS